MNINSDNSKTSDSHQQIHLKRVIDMLLYQIKASTVHIKIYRSLTKVMTFKYKHQHGMINLNFVMDHILYQIFKIILIISSKNNN